MYFFREMEEKGKGSEMEGPDIDIIAESEHASQASSQESRVSSFSSSRFGSFMTCRNIENRECVKVDIFNFNHAVT